MMDALDSLQGSSLDSKAERIARYKAERRRELAERYANLEESSSLYTRREKQRETTDTSEPKKTESSSVLSQYNKDSSALNRQGDRSNSEAKTDATPSSNIVSHSDENSQVTCSHQHHSPLEEAAQNPQEDGKADDDAKTGMPAKTSLLKGLEKTDVSANPKNQAEDSTHNAKPRREHISGKRTVFTSHSSSDEGEISFEERTNLIEDEKISCFQSFTAEEEDARNKDDENVIEKMETQNEQKVRERQCSVGTEEPNTTRLVLQRQDSDQRSIKGILKKSHSTSLDTEPSELEQISTPAIKTCKTLTVVDGKKGKDEEVEDEDEDDDEDREKRRLQREESSSSETPRTPSPDSVDTTPSFSQSVEEEELDSSLDGSMSSSLKERLAEFKSGEDDCRGKLKKNKLTNVVQTSLADRYVQLQESENAWRKKVPTHTLKELPLPLSVTEKNWAELTY